MASRQAMVKPLNAQPAGSNEPADWPASAGDRPPTAASQTEAIRSLASWTSARPS